MEKNREAAIMISEVCSSFRIAIVVKEKLLLTSTYGSKLAIDLKKKL